MPSEKRCDNCALMRDRDGSHTSAGDAQWRPFLCTLEPTWREVTPGHYRAQWSPRQVARRG